EGAGREHGGRLRRDARPDRRAARAAEERGERGRERNRGERLEGGALRALAPRDGGAVVAGAQVRAQRAALAAGQAPVELLRDRELRLVAGQGALELLAQRPSGSEEERLDGAGRDAEDLRDVGVRATFELAHHEGGALVEGEVAEGPADVLRARGLVVDDPVGDVVVEGG